MQVKQSDKNVSEKYCISPVLRVLEMFPISFGYSSMSLSETFFCLGTSLPPVQCLWLN